MPPPRVSSTSPPSLSLPTPLPLHGSSPIANLDFPLQRPKTRSRPPGPPRRPQSSPPSRTSKRLRSPNNPSRPSPRLSRHLPSLPSPTRPLSARRSPSSPSITLTSPPTTLALSRRHGTSGGNGRASSSPKPPSRPLMPSAPSPSRCRLPTSPAPCTAAMLWPTPSRTPSSDGTA